MKKIYSLILVLFGLMAFAQIPNGYYDGTTGLVGEQLKTKLSEIISQGHRDRGYGSLWTAYTTGDLDKFYENDGTILDVYSENPKGADAYNFTPRTNQCGNYKGEGGCYNREHTVPQSAFKNVGSVNSVMTDDYFQVIPTDGYVNARRDSYPFAEVNNASWISKNGSKLGTSSVSGYSGTAFEPIDEFKGDFARTLFYFATRYERNLSQVNFAMFGNEAYPGLSSWALPMLLKWHREDPVSDREITRNDVGYNYQGNRNPYVDNPDFVELIWGDNIIVDIEQPTAPSNLTIGSITKSSVELLWEASADNVLVVGYDVYVNGVYLLTTTTNTAIIEGLTADTEYSFYIVAKDPTGNLSDSSNIATAKTLAENTPTPPATCGGAEDFEQIPESGTGYGDRTWTNNGITWTATDARTDQKIDHKAITIRKGSLASSKISGGIGSLTITMQRKFNGNNGRLSVIINDENKGTLDYTNEQTTQTLENINVEGDIILELKNISGQRVALDNLSWTCYSQLSVKELGKAQISLFPNPVKNSKLYIKGVEKGTAVSIYNLNGQLIQNSTIGNGGLVNLKNITKGVYLVKIKSFSSKIIVE